MIEQKQIPVFTPYFDARETELIGKCLQSGWVAQGLMVTEFEKAVAAYEGVDFAVAVSSCTTALHAAMLAMGLEARHDIIVPSFTFAATANAAEYIGATPVFADVRTDTYCIDFAVIERLIETQYVQTAGGLKNINTGKELFGIVPVGLFGLRADIHAVSDIAARYGLKILEDNACALGAVVDGVALGVNTAVLSFHARKSITTGEGGMILTNDAALADSLRRLRSHGASVSEIARHQNHGFLMPEYNELGYNYRMSDIQGAMGVAQMEKFPKILEMKRAAAARYNSALPKAAPFLKIPVSPAGYFHTYQSYVVTVDYKQLGYSSVEEGGAFRSRLMAYLEQNGVSTRQGTHAVHMLGFYMKKYRYKKEDFPNAYACDNLSIALPLYAGLGSDEQNYVIQNIAEGVVRCVQ